MYTTCIFCKRPLGANEVIETFPVGRRLAFDAAKGRLWVVCRKCHRWNLTPLEERWEAVEDCERIFRETRTRASTENVGIARHREGLDLVRIGKPPRGEFAAWRYGDQFGKRMRRMCLGMAGGGIGVWGLGVSLSAVATAAGVATWPLLAWVFFRTMAKVRVGGGSCDDGPVTPESVARFRLNDIRSLRVLPDEGDPGFSVEVNRVMRKAWFGGEDARRVAGAIVPHLNGWGGSRLSVQRAVREIESSGHPSRFLTDLTTGEHHSWTGSQGFVYSMPKSTRLALEMSLHEEQERRALGGELWILEQAWKEAEEIAAIADSLLLPASADRFLDRLGKKT